MNYIVLAFSLAMVAVCFALLFTWLRNRRARLLRPDAVDAALRQSYENYLRTIRSEAAARAEQSMPDDEWLAAIKARAESRLGRDVQFTAISGQPSYRTPSWDVVESASIGGALKW
jgi:hypothetical protein